MCKQLLSGVLPESSISDVFDSLSENYFWYVTVVYRNCLQLSDCGFFIFKNVGLKKSSISQQILIV